MAVAAVAQRLAAAAGRCYISTVLVHTSSLVLTLPHSTWRCRTYLGGDGHSIAAVPHLTHSTTQHATATGGKTQVTSLNLKPSKSESPRQHFVPSLAEAGGGGGCVNPTLCTRLHVFVPYLQQMYPSLPHPLRYYRWRIIRHAVTTELNVSWYCCYKTLRIKRGTSAIHLVHRSFSLSTYSFNWVVL